MNNILQITVSFLLGAAISTAFFLFYLSADSHGRSIELFAWNINGTQMTSPNETAGDVGTKIDHFEEKETSQELAQLLKQAAMDDNTVIMTAINEAWATPGSLLDLFLESFRAGDRIEHLLKHLIIVAMDPNAFDRCKSVHNFCYFLKVEGVNFTGEQVYMQKDYLKMMWRRNKFQQSVLQMGYNFLFTDVDIMWFRDPFLEISIGAHITISSDVFFGDPDNLHNLANGGFVYAKSSRKTIEFFDDWYLAREKYPGKHEQYVFDQIKFDFSSRFDIKIRFLDTTYMGGFCQPKKDFSKLCTFHANCRVGLESKLHDLRNILEDWKKYKAQLKEKSFSKNSTGSS